MPMRPFALSALLLVALAGCGVPDPPATVASGDKPATKTPTATPDKTPVEKKPTDNNAPGAKPDDKKPVDKKDGKTPPAVSPDAVAAGLKITDTVVGKGEAAEPGDTCMMLYTGKLKNGTIFDSTAKRDNKPFSFPLGGGQVIKGWDLGVKGMKVGGKRTLEIPSALGYGPQGSGDAIPPNSDLVFEIELVDLLKANAMDTVDRTVVKPGTGPAAKAGDIVNITYTGTLVDGTVFDSTAKQGGKPLQFKLSSGMVIQGFDLAITGMKKGETVKVRIPPALGYGFQEKPGIPPNSILNFEITLVSIG